MRIGHQKCRDELECAYDSRDRWYDQYVEARDRSWELSDKLDDQVPFWWAFFGALSLFWIGFWIGIAG